MSAADVTTFDEVTLRGTTFRPARFCAPMAGFTHSAFRRVVAGFGGCGAFWTEMLSARYVLSEDLRRSTWLRRSPAEPRLIYQLLLNSDDRIDTVVGRLSELGPDGLDVNLACDAPKIRHCRAGSRLFDDVERLAVVLESVRRRWPGLLTVKIRLGRDAAGWEERLAERLRAIENCGVDAVIVHPRFLDDRFRRRARHERLAWVAGLTRLPLIANGDLANAGCVARLAADLEPAQAIMIGRSAIVQPWVFAAWNRPMTVDHAAVWRRMVDAIREDFEPRFVLGRVRMFSEYFARNFVYGHSFYASLQGATNIDRLCARAEAFLAQRPDVVAEPHLMGL